MAIAHSDGQAGPVFKILLALGLLLLLWLALGMGALVPFLFTFGIVVVGWGLNKLIESRNTAVDVSPETRRLLAIVIIPLLVIGVLLLIVLLAVTDGYPGRFPTGSLP